MRPGRLFFVKPWSARVRVAQRWSAAASAVCSSLACWIAAASSYPFVPPGSTTSRWSSASPAVAASARRAHYRWAPWLPAQRPGRRDASAWPRRPSLGTIR